MTSPYPLGSGVMRVREVPGGEEPRPPFDPECYNVRWIVDDLTTSSGWSGRQPQRIDLPSTSCAWAYPSYDSMGGNGAWVMDGGGPGGYPLVFPGSDLGSGNDKISGDVPYVESNTFDYVPYLVEFSEVPSVAGSIYWGTNPYDGYRNLVTGRAYEFQPYGWDLTHNYLRFHANDNSYHSDLTGAGTITAHIGNPPGGGGGDYTEIGDGVGTLYQASTGDWGVLLSSGGFYDNGGYLDRTSIVNRDVVLIRFTFRFSRLSVAQATVKFIVGNNTLSFSPSDTYVPGVTGMLSLDTAGGHAETSATGLVPGTWYNAELDVNLLSGLVRGRLYEKDTPAGTWISAPSGGERFMDGTYAPSIKIRVVNADAGMPWQVDFDQIEADVATTGTDAIGDAYGENLFYVLHSDLYSTGTEDAYGAFKDWPTYDPLDGRSYAVAWSDGSTGRGEIGTPGTSLSMVWGLFDDWGPGILHRYDVNVASYALPATEPTAYGGGPFQPEKWAIYGRGEIGLELTGADTGLGGNTATVPVAIRSNDFRESDPFWSDYYALGQQVWYADLTSSVGQSVEWLKWSVMFRGTWAPTVGIAPSTHFQWSLQILGDGGVEELRAAGPLSGGWFMLPNWGGLSLSVRKVEIYMVRMPEEQVFPCTPPPQGDTVTQVFDASLV